MVFITYDGDLSRENNAWDATESKKREYKKSEQQINSNLDHESSLKALKSLFNDI